MSTLYIVGTGSDISKNRQARAKLLKVGDLVRIVREPNNQHDPSAIRVTTIKTEGSPAKTLGYIPKKFSHLLAEVMKKKKKRALKVPVAKVGTNDNNDTVVSIEVPNFW